MLCIVPHDVVITDISWTFAKVSFNPPPKLGTPITKYRAIATQAGVSGNINCTVPGRGYCGSFCYLQNLKPSSKYTVIVKACIRQSNGTVICGGDSKSKEFTSAGKNFK